jgi:hypothetical protein
VVERGDIRNAILVNPSPDPVLILRCIEAGIEVSSMIGPGHREVLFAVRREKTETSSGGSTKPLEPTPVGDVSNAVSEKRPGLLRAFSFLRPCTVTRIVKTRVNRSHEDARSRMSGWQEPKEHDEMNQLQHKLVGISNLPLATTDRKAPLVQSKCSR